jgi:hypothetical protein
MNGYTNISGKTRRKAVISVNTFNARKNIRNEGVIKIIERKSPTRKA